MPDDRTAEILLETVTTRERAASIVGDLRETSVSRGEVWFWWSALRAGAALLWESTTAGVGSLLVTGLIGVVLSFSAELCTSLMYSLGALAWSKITGQPDGMLYTSQTPPSAMHVWWMDSWTGLGMFLALRFLIGRWVAAGAPGRELPACLAFEVIEVALACVLGFALHTHSAGLLVPCTGSVVCLLGALSVRRMRIEETDA